MYILCPKCKAANVENAEFCSLCGGALQSQVSSETKRKATTRSDRKRKGTSALGSLIGPVTLWFVLCVVPGALVIGYAVSIGIPNQEAITSLIGIPDEEAITLLIAGGLGMMTYFVPAVIAYKRERGNKQAIFWLNLLAGWLFVGWVVAFVWAVSTDPGKVKFMAQGTADTRDPTSERES